MSDTVDDRVVAMSFENDKFESGVAKTLSTIDKLKSALNFTGSDKGLEQVQAEADQLNMSKFAQAIDTINKRFSLMGVAVNAVIGTIASQLTRLAEKVVSSFTLDPVMAGFQNYETQIQAVQTILANTGLKGASGLDQVNAALKQLNTYANQTVYNFSDMAKNIGTFTAAGVDLKTSTQAIQGIANLAALSGSSAEQASTAMYQLSQAIAAGQVKLQDWNSVVNAGIGGKVFQEALFNTAKTMGTIKDVPITETFDQWTKAGNTFRGSLQQGWLTSKVLTTTLGQFTGQYTDAQLKAIGYTDDQIKAIQEQAKTANDAATKIKTMTQLMQALKEEVATAWAAIFKTIFGDINQATDLFSSVHTAAENALTNPIYALNNLLEGADKLGARDKVLDGFKNALTDIGAVIKPIESAFREIFPAETAQNLADMADKFDKFTKELKIGADTADNIKRTFAGLFAALDIGWQIIKDLGGVLADLFKTASGGGTAVLGVTGTLGDFLVALDKAIKEGGLLNGFFEGLEAVLKIPIELLKNVAQLVSGLFSGFNPGGFSSFFNGLASKSNSVGQAVSKSLGNLPDLLSKIETALDPFVKHVESMWDAFTAALDKAFSSPHFDEILKTFQTGLLAAIVLALKKFVSNGVNIDLGGGFLGSIKESLEELTGVLSAMQTQLKADALKNIGIAIALIAAAVAVLALIPADRLKTSMTALSVAFGELLAAMAILVKVTGTAGFVKIPVMAASLGILAGALDLLVLAVAGLAAMNTQELQRGLTALGVLIAGLIVTSKPLASASEGMIAAGVGLTALGVALNVIVLAINQMSKIDSSSLLKGLAGIGTALVIIAGAMQLMPTGMVAMGAGLVLVAEALKQIADAVQMFGQMSLEELAKGLASIGTALVLIAGAMQLMPKGMVLQAAALVAVGVALQAISKAVGSMGNLSWTEIAKGLTGIAGALTILVVAMKLMTSALLGAAALVTVSAALSLLAGTMETLGQMSWGDILKSLVAIAAALAVLGGAALLLSPLTPVILALGVALLALSAAVALAGVGIEEIAKAFGILFSTVPGGIATLLSAIEGFVEDLPKMLTALAQSIVDFATIIGSKAGVIVGAMQTMAADILKAVVDLAPKVAAAANAMIQSFLNVVTTSAPRVVQAAFDLIEAFLEELAKNIPKIVDLAAQIIVNFIDGLAKNLGKIVDAAFNFVITFVNSLADTCRDRIPELIDAGYNLAEGIIEGVVKGIGELEYKIWDALKDALGGMVSSALSFLGIHSPSTVFANMGEMLMLGGAKGIDDNADKMVQSVVGVGDKVVDKMQETLSNLPTAVNGQLDINPVITPVLDLSNVSKDASKINDMMVTAPIGASTSYGQASSILANQQAQAAQQTTTTPLDNGTQAKIEFNQYNSSPKALDSVTIYRQTKNQLSLVKEALKVS